ncbi:MAG TPA: hypothetical protein VKY90_12310 [Candidatus Dormibacteraeota bacterium]|nr:hypothetical protein [Candidatus Dormibacteraeota bacterium]
MGIVGRVVAFVLGLIASAIALVVDILYSAMHRALGVLGSSSIDQTHGFIGFLLVLIGVLGSILALFLPLPAAVLLLAAGIGMFFVVKGYALFSILFFVLAAVLSFAARPSRRMPSADNLPR